MTEPTPTERPPWEQRDGESAAAFRAFGLYKAMPPGERSVDAVARLLSGHREGTKRAPGRLKGWASGHEWVARAAAWDRHIESTRASAAEEAAADQGKLWGQRRDEALDEVYQVGWALLKASRGIIDRYDQAAAQPGGAAPDSGELRRAALIAREAEGLLRGSIAQATPPDLSPGQSIWELSQTPEVQAEAAKRLEEWKEEKRRQGEEWAAARAAELASDNPVC